MRRDEVVGVGMGLPGPVHRPSGELGNSTILPGWVGVRAADAVSAALGHAVQVENDANLGALGEWMWGAGRGADHMAYVKAATGIGAGLHRRRAAVRRRRRDGGRDRPHRDRSRRPDLPLRQPRLPGDAGRRARRPRLAARRPRRRPHARRGGRLRASAATPAAGARSPTPGQAIGTRRRHAVQPLQPAAGRRRRRSGRRRRAAARRRCARRCGAARSAPRPTTSTSSRASWASARRCWAPSRSCSGAGRRPLPLDTWPFGYEYFEFADSRHSAATGGRGEHEAASCPRGRRRRRVLAALAFTVAACGDDEPSTAAAAAASAGEPETKGKVGVILPDAASSARWETADRQFLGEAFEAAGVESDIQNANGDKAKFAHDRRPDAQRRRDRAADRQPRQPVGGGGHQEGHAAGRAGHRL